MDGVVFNICLGQSPKSKKPLRFILEVLVVDKNDSTLLENANVNVIGTDSSSLNVKTDSNGFVSIELKPFTSYTLTISAEGFLNSKGQETTINYERSTRFLKKFFLQELSTCRLYYPTIAFKVNDFQEPFEPLYPEFDLIESFSTLIIENDYLSFTIRGFQEENEIHGIALKRVEYFYRELIDRGVPEKRLQIIYGDTKESALEYAGYPEEDQELIPNNRVIIFKTNYDKNFR